MKKSLLQKTSLLKVASVATILCTILCNTLYAQNIGINSTGNAPNASAGLDVDFTDKGLLIPRVALTSRIVAAPVVAPATSLLVYNTATAGVVPNNVLPGYYYWDGAKWVTFTGAGSGDWSLLGNAGTVAGTNFIGTTDAIDWVMKTNNTERARILSTGNYGIGTSTPVSNLHLNGNMVWGNGTNATSVGGVLFTDQGGSIQLGGLDVTANPVVGGKPLFDWKYGNGLIQDYNVRIINEADEKLSFYTLTSFPYSGGVPLMTLNQNRVGIGTSTPSVNLEVNDPNNGIVRLSSNTGFRSTYFASGFMELNENNSATGLACMDFHAPNGIIDDYSFRVVNIQKNLLQFFSPDFYPYGATALVTMKENRVGFGINWPTALVDVQGTFKLGTLGDVSTALKRGTFAVDIPSTANVTASTVAIALGGALVGDIVIVQPPSNMDGRFVLIGATVTGAGVVTIAYRNLDTAGGADDPVSCNWSYIIVRP